MEDKGFIKYLGVLVAVGLAAFGITKLLQRPRKPRSFREDPIGALKDHSEIVAIKAQAAGEDAIERLQATLEEIRDRLPDVNSKQFRRTRKDLNKRVADLSSQAQDLVKELRANGMFNR